MAYLLYFQSENFLYYVLDFESNSESSQILKIFSFYHVMPIFLTLLSVLQIDSSKSKQLCLPMALYDLIPALSLYNIKGKNMTNSGIILIVFHLISIITNSLAYFSS